MKLTILLEQQQQQQQQKNNKKEILIYQSTNFQAKVLTYESVDKLIKGTPKFLNGFESNVFALKNQGTVQVLKY